MIVAGPRLRLRAVGGIAFLPPQRPMRLPAAPPDRRRAGVADNARILARII